MEIVAAADSIFYVKELLSQETCRTIIAIYERDSRRHPGCILRGRGEKELQEAIKVSTDLVISPEGMWAHAFNEVNLAVNDALRQITAQVPSLQIWPLWWTGYKIQHYKRDQGHFKWHFDAIGPGTWERQLAMVIYLNTVQEGGETCFHRQNLEVKPIAGDAVIFPTFWTHAHCGQIPRSEDKYIISSFVSFDIPSAGQKDGRKGLAEAHSNLGSALRGVARFNEAIASYRRAVAIDPRCASAYRGLGDVLRDLGDHDGAAVHHRRAIELDPTIPGIDLGSCRVQALGSRSSPAWNAMTNIRTMTPRDAAWLANAERLFATRADAHPR